MRIIFLICLLTVCVMVNGCATVTTSPLQRVPVITDPSGAKVTTNTGHGDVTPCVLELERRKSHLLTIEKYGYKTAQVALKQTLCGATAGNLIVGGVIGLGVDVMTGSCFKLVPEEVNVILEKEVIE